MTDRKGLPNPFESDVVTDPAHSAPADVPVIHRSAFESCRRAFRSVADQRRSWSVLMYGEAGCGKTHLLSRLRKWLEGGLEAAPPVRPALFVAVRMETDPGHIWRHVRRRFAEELTRRTAEGATPLDALLTAFAADRTLEAALEQSPVADLGLDLARVLEHYAAGRHRRLSRSWLLGDALTESDYAALCVAAPMAQDLDEDLAESDSRRVVLAVTRLSGPAPVVFCFDQIEAIGLAQQTNSYGAFSRMGASIVDETENALVVSTVLSGFLGQLQDGSMQSDFQRISKDRADLKPLDWELCNRLIEARLALVPGLSGDRPIAEADLRIFFEKQHGQCTPRALIHEARRLFNRWQQRDEPPAPTAAQFLGMQFETLWSRSPARNGSDETNGVLGHGVPILLDLLNHRTQNSSARNVDLNVDSKGSKLRIAYGNQLNMTALARWLAPLAEHSAGDPLCLVRDARLPISPTAKTALQRISKIIEAGGRIVRVDAEAVAALDAMRRLLAQATSGDLSLQGEPIQARTVRDWLAANLPRGLAKFAEDLLGRSPRSDDPSADALLELLRAQKVVTLEDAVRLSQLPRPVIENYARSHPDHVGLFGGPCPVVCLAVAPPAQGGGDDAD